MTNNRISKSMLVFHSAYTYDHLKKFGMEIFVQARDAGNFFDRVLTVSPVANLQYLPSDKRNYTKPEFFQLDSRNIILEGKVTRFRLLNKMPRLNFILAQFSLLSKILIKGGLRDVEVVRAEDPRLNGLYGYFFSKLLRRPLIVGVWGNPGRLREMNQTPNMPRLFPSMRIEEMVEKFVLRRATFVLAQNSENMSYAIGAGVPMEKQMLTELGIGIDESHFLPFDLRMDVSQEIVEWNLDGKFVLICISRLEKSKMVDHAILSTICLKKSTVNFKLIIVGDGSEMLNLKSLAVDHNLEESIIFAGNRSQAWISGFLKHVDLNVAPLCGRSLLEASLAGCPAVAYDLDWHNIIVKDSVTGFLVPPLDHNLLGQRLLDAYKNPSLRSIMRSAIKELATEFANRDGIRQKQMNLYKSLTKK